MNKQKPSWWSEYRRIHRAMQLGANAGYDPYNSAVTFARFYW